jgi:hypothetical protein
VRQNVGEYIPDVLPLAVGGTIAGSHVTDVEDSIMGNGLGHFVGVVQVEWVRGAERDHNMRLLVDFAFVDPAGKTWTAKTGFETDGASIPRAFWTLVGGPFEGQYREAAVIHDEYCFLKTETWQATHRVFLDGMLASGVSEELAKTLYAGVMLGGPRWGPDVDAAVPEAKAGTLIDAVKVRPDEAGRATRTRDVSNAEAQVVYEWVRANNPTREQIDSHILSHFPEKRPEHSGVAVVPPTR